MGNKREVKMIISFETSYFETDFEDDEIIKSTVQDLSDCWDAKREDIKVKIVEK